MIRGRESMRSECRTFLNSASISIAIVCLAWGRDHAADSAGPAIFSTEFKAALSCLSPEIMDVSVELPTDAAFARVEEVYQQGIALYSDGCYSAALRHFDAVARSRHYKSFQARLNLLSGLSQLYTGDKDDALECLEEAYRGFRSIRDHIRFIIAQTWYARQKYAKAHTHFEKLLKEYPHSNLVNQALQGSLNSLLEMNKPRRVLKKIAAIERHYKVRRIYPHYPQWTSFAWIQARAYKLLKHYDTEAATLTELFLGGAASVYWYPARVRLQTLREDGYAHIPDYSLDLAAHLARLNTVQAYKEVLSIVDRLAVATRQNSKVKRSILYQYAKAWYGLQYYNRADSLFDELARLSPDKLDKYLPLYKWQSARTKVRADSLASAYAACSTLAAQHPSSRYGILASYEIIWLHAWQGKYRQAVHQLDQYRASYGRRARYRHTLSWLKAWFVYLNRNYERALSLFTSLRRRGERSSYFRESMYWSARCLQQLGRTQEAAELYDSLASNEYFSWYRLTASQRLLEIFPQHLPNDTMPFDSPWWMLTAPQIPFPVKSPQLRSIFSADEDSLAAPGEKNIRLIPAETGVEEVKLSNSDTLIPELDLFDSTELLSLELAELEAECDTCSAEPAMPAMERTQPPGDVSQVNPYSGEINPSNNPADTLPRWVRNIFKNDSNKIAFHPIHLHNGVRHYHTHLKTFYATRIDTLLDGVSRKGKLLLKAFPSLSRAIVWKRLGDGNRATFELNMFFARVNAIRRMRELADFEDELDHLKHLTQAGDILRNAIINPSQPAATKMSPDDYSQRVKSLYRTKRRAAYLLDDSLKAALVEFYLDLDQPQYACKWYARSFGSSFSPGIGQEFRKRILYPFAWRNILGRISDSLEVPLDLVAAVMRTESRFDTAAVSNVGATGLMQVMPLTGERIADSIRDTGSMRMQLSRPVVNVTYGVWYLKKLIDNFDGQLPLAIASYNGGPHNVSRWLNYHPDLPWDEFIETMRFSQTRHYTKKVLLTMAIYRLLYAGQFTSWDVTEKVRNVNKKIITW
ncbi:MAG: transglycosylase SLT domain-containing protein [Chitinivibrionales bacterium]|nr:transglycosylase SLT domain-containing protein [Chitinivibrionales bacterium]